MDLRTTLVTSDGFFEKLMSCPLKRKLVIDLIESEKNNIEEYKKKLADQKCLENTSDQSPLRKVQKKYVCESPTALLRRRALEKKNSADIQWSPAQNTLLSSLPAISNKILAGVVAFIDVKSKDHDRSGGVKALLHCMGATIEEQFNREVTHVIFKDGSFSTYQRANLLKVHLVSVLWIEACRNSGVKVAEKKFPALGTGSYDHNVSALCSQLQKDYEDIIREEYCQSMISGTPLPSTRAIIDKRRTIMTPNASNSSFIEKNWSQASEDTEVAEINQRRKNNCSSPDQSHMTSSPEITEDDSDLGPFISGEMIEKNTFGSRKISIMDPLIPTEELNNTNNSQLAGKVSNSSIQNSSPKTPYGFYNKNTPKIDRSRIYNNIDSDIFFQNCSDSDGSACKRRTRSQSNKKDVNSSCLTDTVDDTPLTKKKLMQMPTCASFPKRDMTSKNTNKIIELSSKTNIPSERRYDILNKSSSTNMSTLQLSNNHVENSSNTNMSVLQVSSDTNKNTDSFNSKNNSFSPVQSNVMNNLLHLLDRSLQSSDNITRRHKKTISESLVSDEIRKDDVYSEVDEIDSVGSYECDNNEDFINKSPNKKLKTNKETSSYPGKSKSEILQHENTLPEISDKKIYRKTGKSICNATKNCKTHNGSIKVKNDKSSADLLGNHNSLELFEVGKIQKTSNSLSIKSSSITVPSERKKKINSNGRKLYDPTDSSQGHFLRNDRERENVGRNSKSSHEFLKPEVILSVRAKRFVDKHNINVEKILGDHSEQFHDGNQKLRNKKRNTNQSVEKHITGDDDEQHMVKRQILAQKCAEKCDDTNRQIVEDSVKEIIDTKNLYVEVGTYKENMSNTFKSQPLKPDEKSAKRRCSLRLTQRSKKLSTDTISTTEGKLDRNDNSEQTHDTNHKARRLLVQKFADKCGNINLSNERKTKKVNLSSTTSPYPKTVKTRQLQPDEKFSERCSPRTEKKIHQDVSENRRSTREFQSKLSSKKNTKIDKFKQPSIVCTKMHKDEIQVFSQIVKKLGGFIIEDEVTRKTTHLVAGEPRRTLNMLRAIVTGCWIVSQEWLFQSLEAGKWLPEEDFELTEFSPAVQQCRLQRQAFGASYSMDTFHDCGPIFIAKGSTPRCSDLRELVSLSKGKCTNNARNSKIVVGELLKYDGVICVKENWILDSITVNRRMPFKNYIIPSNSATRTA